MVYMNEEKRHDGRNDLDLRPIEIELGVNKNSDGSCLLKWGKNIVLVTVHGPKPMFPKHLSDPNKAVIDYKYRMACFSVTERKSPVPGKRDKEISLVSANALESAIETNKFPNTVIEINTLILSADAGTRVAALTAASLAAADAGLPMKGLISAVAAGRSNKKFVLDLDKHEEDADDAVDMAYAALMPHNEVALLQMDGYVNINDCETILDNAVKGAEKVYEIQKKALIKKYPLEGEIYE
jgi:exosome complex component RRP41